MKRFVLIFTTIILLTIAALAIGESEYYTSDEDWYYHASASCGFRSDLRLATEEETASKYPCYICVEDERSYAGLEGFKLDNTIIVRMSDEWIRGMRDKASGIFADTSPRSYDGLAMRNLANRWLRGADYESFMQAFINGDDIEIPVYYTDSRYFDGYFSEGNRHIGSAWLTSVSVDDKEVDLSNEYYDFPRFFCGSVLIKQGVFYEHITDEWGYEDVYLPLTDISEGKIFKHEGGNTAISLYSYDGINLLKLTKRIKSGLEQDRSYDFTLFIENRAIDYFGSVNVTKDGEEEYICFLTDAEAQKVIAGADVGVLLGVCFEESFSFDHAVFTADPPSYTSFRVGIADRNIDILLDRAEMKIIELSDCYICKVNEKTELRGRSGVFEEGMAVLDRQTLELKSFIPGKYLWYRDGNSSAYIISSYKGDAYICDAKTHEILAYYSYDENDRDMPFIYGDLSIRASYPKETEMPERLVLQTENGFSISDNYGNKIGESFEMLEPLIWYKGRGLFLIESGADDTCKYPNEMFELGYSGQSHSYHWERGVIIKENPDFRCGIADENGNVLAECVYTRVRIISDSAVELTDAGGETAIIDIGE